MEAKDADAAFDHIASIRTESASQDGCKLSLNPDALSLRNMQINPLFLNVPRSPSLHTLNALSLHPAYAPVT